MSRVHGGPDALGTAIHDLSTGSHPAGANPMALARVRAADPSRYPDPSYAALKALLAQRHQVAPSRLLMAASGSEFIQRITAVSVRLAPGAVRVPQPAYGDYAAAALACGRQAVHEGSASLRWCAEPGSPDGRSLAPPEDLAATPTVLDLAYAPLRLDGRSGWPQAARDAVFQLITPNKALGLCGVRGAFAIAPLQAPAGWVEALRAAEPSWPLGAQGVALLEAWCDEAVQAHLAHSLAGLRGWRSALVDGLQARGFRVAAGVTPFVMARLPAAARWSASDLRWTGVAVRDLTSFGLPGHWRINAGPPEALTALWKALDS
jgi:histidinol-phosphate aminotransferase